MIYEHNVQCEYICPKSLHCLFSGFDFNKPTEYFVVVLKIGFTYFNFC